MRSPWLCPAALSCGHICLWVRGLPFPCSLGRLGSQTQFQHGRVGPIPTNNSGCPGIQVCSDLLYPRIASDPAGLRAQSHTLATLTPLHSDQLAIDRGAHNPFLGSINFLEWLTEFRKTCLLTRLLIYYKGYNSVLLELRVQHGSGPKYSGSLAWKALWTPSF